VSIQSHISKEMSRAVGAELFRRTSFPVSAADIRRWAIAIYYPVEPPRIFWDCNYATTTSHCGIVAPEDFNPFAWMAADPAGLPRDGDPDIHRIEERLGINPPGTSFELNGGMEVEYGARIHPHDVITSVGQLDGYRESSGRLGLMLWTTTTDTWTNQLGDLVRSFRFLRIRY